MYLPSYCQYTSVILYKLCGYIAKYHVYMYISLSPILVHNYYVIVITYRIVQKFDSGKLR